MIPRWAGDFVGLHYEDKGRGPTKYDCWGLVKAILNSKGISIPSYRDFYKSSSDIKSVSKLIEDEKPRWAEIFNPRELDIIVLCPAGRPWHCGVMVDSENFLHIPPPAKTGREQLSCIESIKSPQWEHRIEGFYRHD